MEEEKKIMEKRSSLKGWKERNQGKSQKRRNIVIMAIAMSIFLALAIYPYLNLIEDDDQPVKQQNSSVKKIKTNSSMTSNTSKKTTNDTSKKVTASKNNTNIIAKKIIGKIGTPLVSNGFEIVVKSVTPSDLRVTAWVTVRNKEKIEKSFKFGPDTIIIDNMGQQYERIKVARSAEIPQTNLYGGAMVEGAVFFNRLKEGRTPTKLILNIENDKIEFDL